MRLPFDIIADVSDSGQLNLFGDDPTPQRGVAPAAPSPTAQETASQLAPRIHLGASSWSFPGWAGLVYRDNLPAATLARDGLAAYARHPLLRMVGIDRTYYGPIAAADFAAYARATPPAFRFMVKAHNWLTQPRIRERGADGAANWRPNAHFLDPAYAIREVVDPMLAGLGARAGPLVFQFEPMAPRVLGDPRVWLDRVHAFLTALPPGPLYAIEIRNHELLTPAYAALLADTGAVHCYTIHPNMPPIPRQCDVCDPSRFSAAVIRWMLRRNLDYAAAQRRYDPFDRIVDPDDAARDDIAELLQGAIARDIPAYCTINNKAEGSAPRSVERLAARIVGRGEASRGTLPS